MPLLSQNNLRRLRTYSRRSISTAQPKLKHPCFFMHVPKCGGTSVSEGLYATVPMSKRIGVIDANATRRATAIMQANENQLHLYHDDLPNGGAVFEMREQMLLTHMAWKTQLIHGHILFSQKADTHFGETYKYVSLLREPLARLVSNYNGSVAHGLTKTDFKTYLGTDVARYHALTTLRYFTGQHTIQPGQERQAVDTALATSEKFAVIGFLDDLDRFCTEYDTTFGRKPVIYHYNSKTKQSYQPTPQELDLARELLEPEFRFWQEIRSK